MQKYFDFTYREIELHGKMQLNNKYVNMVYF